MTKLSEILKKHAAYTKESLSDPRPSGNKRTVPPGRQKELEEVSAMTPPKIGWRIFLILFCVFIGVIMVSSPEYGGDFVPAIKVFYFAFCTIPPTVALTVTYCVKRGVYNRRMERKWMIQREIKEVEDHNRSLEESRDKWEAREKRREEQMRSLMREARKLIASKEYFDQLLSADATDMETELSTLCAYLLIDSDISITDTYLFRSIDASRDIAITESSISFHPVSGAWTALENAGQYNRQARLLYYVSVWKMNERLRYYCGELMLDKSVVPSGSVDDFLAQHNCMPSSTGAEHTAYKTLSSEKFEFSNGMVKGLVNQILQSRRLREQMVGNNKKKLPAPMWELVPTSERLVKLRGLWDYDNDETAAYLNRMNVEIFNQSKSVHAGDKSRVSPSIRAAKACSIPTESNVQGIEAHAFEEVPHLECLSIPKNIININGYIFSSRATPHIIHIIYQGGQSEWNKVSLTNNWARLPNGGCVIVHCTDTSFVA